MKLPKKKQSKETLKRSDSKRHKAIFESDSTNSSRYTRRCMSTELLQLLCIQRSFLNIAEHSQHSPRRKSNFSKEKSLSPQRFVNISTWSLSTKEAGNESSDYFEKDKSNFQDFVNLYSKVKDFQSRNHENEPDYDTHRSLSLPSVDTLPSFAHLLSELTSYFNEDIEQFYDDDSTELSRDDTATGYLKSNGNRTNRCFREELSDYSSQDPKLNPNIPNFVVESNIYKKSSLDDFLSRISRTAPKVCDKCFIFSDTTDLSSRLQASSTRMCDHIDKKTCKRIPRNKKKVLKLKEKSGGNSSPRKNARVRSSKSDSDNNQTTNTEIARCCDNEDKKMTLQKSIKNNKCDQKKLLEMFQLLFKKHKARERLNAISTKLPPRRGSLNSDRTKSKIGGRSCERTLEKKHNLSNSHPQSVNNSKTPLPRKDSLPFHARNMDKSSSTPKSPKSLKFDTSPPKQLGERPVPFPRKPKVNVNIDSEQISTDVSSKENDYSATTSDLDSSKNKYVVRSRAKDSSSSPSFEMEREKQKPCINLRDGFISNSISSPDSSCCSPKDDVEDLSLVRLRNKLSLYDKDVLDDQICDRYNVENYGNQRFWTGVLKTLLTPVSRNKEVSFKSSKNAVIPGPFSASLTNLLKQNLPDVSLQDDFYHYSSFASSSHHLPLSYTTSLPSCLDSSTISSSIVQDKVSIDCFNKFSDREDSVMGNQSFSSLLTLQESQTCKYSPTGATSSDLVLDQCWPGHQLALSDSSMKLTPLKIFSKTAINEAISDIEHGQETLISNTVLRDKVFFHASDVTADDHRTENNNKVSVCVQTDSLNKCSASTSFSNLTKRTDSNDSTMMIVKQLTKLHKLVSVPLSNAPLISQISRLQRSPEVSPKSRSKSRASKVLHRTTMKKVVKRRTPSPLFSLKTRSQQENICIEIPDKEAVTKSEPIRIQAFTDDSSDCVKGITLFSDKSSTSSKQRKVRNKKSVNNINCEKVKYFENRNRNVSYRNANMNQNFGCGDDFKNSNCNSNVKNQVVGGESSSTDDDTRDKTLVPVIVNSVPEEQSLLNVNDKFSRFMNQGRYVEALETTFEKGFSVDREDPWSGERALVCAVVKSRQEIISRLLDLGAILDAPDYNGRTAFLASAIQVDHVAAWILLSHGLEVFCAAPLKVAHGRSKNIAQFAKFLELTLLCGYNPGKELKWFETVLKSNSPNSTNDQQLIISTQNLLSSCRQPSTLSMLCFTSIRRHLSKINKGRSIASSINRLPLPNLLKRFLCMEGVV